MSTWLFMPVEATDEMIEESGLDSRQAIDVWEKMAMASPRPVATDAGVRRREELDKLMVALVAAGTLLGEFGGATSAAVEVIAKIESIKAQIRDLLA